jgi:hypothetical protein
LCDISNRSLKLVDVIPGPEFREITHTKRSNFFFTIVNKFNANNNVYVSVILGAKSVTEYTIIFLLQLELKS